MLGQQSLILIKGLQVSLSRLRFLKPQKQSQYRDLHYECLNLGLTSQKPVLLTTGPDTLLWHHLAANLWLPPSGCQAARARGLYLAIGYQNSQTLTGPLISKGNRPLADLNR